MTLFTIYISCTAERAFWIILKSPSPIVLCLPASSISMSINHTVSSTSNNVLHSTTLTNLSSCMTHSSSLSSSLLCFCHIYCAQCSILSEIVLPIQMPYYREPRPPSSLSPSSPKPAQTAVELASKIKPHHHHVTNHGYGFNACKCPCIPKSQIRNSLFAIVPGLSIGSRTLFPSLLISDINVLPASSYLPNFLFSLSRLFPICSLIFSPLFGPNEPFPPCKHRRFSGLIRYRLHLLHLHCKRPAIQQSPALGSLPCLLKSLECYLLSFERSWFCS